MGGGDIYPPQTEHHRLVYQNSSDTGAMYDRYTASERTGDTVVLGERESRIISWWKGGIW